MGLVAGPVQYPGVGVEGASPTVLAGFQGASTASRASRATWCISTMRRRLADREGAHHGGVVVAVGAGPLQGQLVLRVEMAPAGVVAAQQGAARPSR